MVIQKYKDQRVGIFIDVQNLYHSAKHLYQARVNYKELIDKITAGRKLIRAIAYVVKSDTALVTEESSHQQKETGEALFFEALEKAGVELRIKDLQIFPGGLKKADWDVGLAVDAIRMASFLEAVVLATGDGDFLPLVDYLKWGMGRRVEVVAFGRSSSAKLKEAADDFFDIAENPRLLIPIKK